MLDGSPQGKTAYLSQPYYVVPEGRPADYRGYPAMNANQVMDLVMASAGKGHQIIAHANGDAAADQLIEAVQAMQAAQPGRDHRTVMIHAQTVREDQLDAMAELGIVPSFFSAHTFFWGDWHRDSVLGPERGARISPAASALAREIPFTLHSDAPVVPPDAMRLVSSVVTRKTRSGQVLGPEQRIDIMQALAALTRNGARQYFEERDKGTLEVGKLADLVILDRDPRRVPPDELATLPVRETWSRGRRIHPMP
jgi:predicted amidohydrolase YtcJ